LDLLLFGFRGLSTKNETFRNLHGPRQAFPIPRFRFVFRMYPFRQYLVFSCLIRNSAVMGIPVLESIQTGAPDDAQIVHFGQDPICTKITPLSKIIK